MSRLIFPLPVFERRLIKFLRYHPELKSAVYKTMRILTADLSTPLLRTHKLQGKLNKSYSCDINYQYRLVFSFDAKYIYLENIGSHDDVY